jgi:N-acetylglutamate synthase-like GNAT family acetyltransferase
MVTLEKATVADAPRILEVKLRSFSKEHEFYGPRAVPPRFNLIERQIQVLTEQSNFYKIMKNGAIIGGALVVDLGEGKFVLASLFVDLPFQNQGIGSEALTRILHMFPQAKRWVLDTPYLSYRNHHFYEKFGFKKVGEHVPDYAVGSDFRLFDYEKIVGENPTAYDVYLYGMTILSTSYLLQSDYPEADGYAEIVKSYTFPGGETGSCATVLAGLGVRCKLDGNYLGGRAYHPVIAFYQNRAVDTSRITCDPEFDGLEDMVVIGGPTRTCFGRFQRFFAAGEPRRWNTPQKQDVARAKVVGLDPFFGLESALVAKYCHELGKPYVTIDCKYDSPVHHYSAVNVVSNEYIKSNYAGVAVEELFRQYTANTDGLVIFTFGSKEILSGRKGETINKLTPYQVKVESTLGAGDAFKAGAVYGLLRGMNDRELVSFAAATAALVCGHYPLPLYPPTLEQVAAVRNDTK